MASAVGVDPRTARVAMDEMDREALRAVGLDITLDPPPLPDAEPARRPPRPTFRAVWQGRLPLTPAAKTVLQESSKEMRGFGGHHLGPQRVLEVLLSGSDPTPRPNCSRAWASTRRRCARVWRVAQRNQLEHPTKSKGGPSRPLSA